MALPAPDLESKPVEKLMDLMNDLESELDRAT